MSRPTSGTLDNFYKQALTRMRMATVDRLERKDLAQWIEQNTYIQGRPFSFKDHEYQEKILSDTSPEVVIRKSAQTGISEMSLRMAAGLVMLMPDAFSVGYTFPTASFSSQYSKTRFDPIVRGSPALRAAIGSDDVDTAEVKSFGPGRQVYFKGAAAGNAAISTTLDMLVHDELSFSDQDVIGDYHSRLIHSKYKWKVKLSTPTFPGDPIDVAFNSSRRHWNFCKCQHCNHLFIPDYYDHVKIPGFTGHLDEIVKENLHTVRFQDAVLICPKCGKAPSLQPAHRQWVVENPDENHLAAGYQVQPFDAPNVVTLPDLVIASTSYASKAKFRQFSLGKPAADADAGLTESDLDAMGIELPKSPFHSHVIGGDMGLMCHILVGGMNALGQLVVVHAERIPVHKFDQRFGQLVNEYRATIKVLDSQPYLDLITRWQTTDPNLYGALYVSRNGLDTYDVRMQNKDADNALAAIRQVNMNRNAMFDKVLGEARAGNIKIAKGQEWDRMREHLQDMKRATATLRNGEFTSVWQKSSKGADHYHHALGYLYVAAQMRGIAMGSMDGLNLGLSKFTLNQTKAKG